MKKVFTVIAVLIAMSISLQAADVPVTDDGSGVGTTTWTSDNVYILDGLVFVNDGQVLTIEAGTVVKGKPGQEENASALIVARGGKLIAEGTVSAPIIFTAEADDLAGSVDEKARGLWGGVILLGKGINNNPTDEKAIEGIPTSEPRGLYGAATTVEDDMSASMKYVSIRHGGTDIGEGNEINGLTLGACGSGTTVSYLEVLSNKDDGVEFFGGSPRLDHILVAYAADDSYDYDEGYSGFGQYWAVLQDPVAGDRMGEHDGGPSSNQLGTPFAHPIISNATYIGRGTGAGKRVITFRDNAGGEYHNSIFVNQEKGIDIEFRGADGGSYDRFVEGNLVLANNIFSSVADGTDAGIFKVVSELDDNDDPIYNVTQTELDAFANHFDAQNNTVADPQVTLDHPTPKGNVSNPVFPAGLDDWFEQVNYKGAFEPGRNWAYGWSKALGTFEPEVTEPNTEVVRDAGEGVGGTDVTWSADKTWVLDGFVFVNDGQTLTIEPGTVVKGKPGQEENASALIVAKGGKLIAEGTANAPIIFTAEADNLGGSVDMKARGLWGGVILLGKGINNNPTDEKAIEGIPTSEPRGLYGAATTVEDDMSASMKYVSIRHGGTDIGEGNEINGLTLGACGSGTTVSYLEVLSNKDDGVEFFGGSPRMDHILVAYCADDSYDYDEGFSGYGQFWAVLQDPLAGDRMGEHDGGPSSNQLGQPYAHPVVFNATFIGRGAGAGKRVITFRDNAGGEYHNSIFVNQEKGIDIEFRGNDGGSYDRFAEGNLALANNIFHNVADGTAEGIFKVVSEEDDNDDPIYNVTQTELDAFANAFADNGNVVADPQVTLAHPTPKGDVGNPVYPSGLDSWFSKVGYKGAFEPDENWAANWSASLGDFTPDPRPEGEVIVQDDGNGIGGTAVTWTSNNTYILDGLVFVNDGQTLTIEGGTVIKGKPGQEENASALVVARGGKIIATGSENNPIIFTAEADDLQGSVDDKARGLWGGVILLGKGTNNNNTTDKAIEGIPTSETRGLYGGNVEDDESGTLKYVSIRHGGTDIGEGNEINGLTLGSCGTGTDISYVEVVANKDDGVEWFGGAPRLHHILVAWCADDSYDYDEGFRGYNQFMCAIQDPIAGDRLGEHDGGPSSNQLGQPYAHPVFSNATYVGRGSGAGKKTITFRDNAGGEYHNSVFASQEKGIDIEFRGADGGSYDRFDEGNLVLANNIFYDIADGSAEGIFQVVSEKDDNDDPIYNVTQTELDAFAGAFDTNSNDASIDPVVTADNPTIGGDYRGADFSNLPEWFTVVDYKGAFEPNENWAQGWTLSLGDVNARNNPFVSTRELAAEDAVLNVYPNPMTDYATVEFDNFEGNAYTFTMFDMSGRAVKVISNIRSSRFTVDRDGLKSGLYLYRMTGENGRVLDGKLFVQ